MSEIRHVGIIERKEGASVFVRITQKSACSGCHAKSVCAVSSDVKDKVIEVPSSEVSFVEKEQVMLCGQTSMGLKAVGLAFVIPLFLIIAVLIIVQLMGLNDVLGALLSIGILGVWYGIVYLLKDKLEKRFVFTIKKYKH